MLIDFRARKERQIYSLGNLKDCVFTEAAKERFFFPVGILTMLSTEVPNSQIQRGTRC